MEEHILITSNRGVSFAGIKEHCPKAQWMAVRPSIKSEIVIFFDVEHIDYIIHQDGTKEEPGRGKEDDIQKEDGIKKEDDIKKDCSTACASSDKTQLLIRVRGGISYRGTMTEKILNKPAGYWLKPSACGDIVIYAPETEVERVYSS